MEEVATAGTFLSRPVNGLATTGVSGFRGVIIAEAFLHGSSTLESPVW